MRLIRLLILVLVLATTLFVALIRPLPGRADNATGSKAKEAARPEPRRVLMSRARDSGHFGNRVVRYARRFLGVRYTWGGSSPRTGFDCSGFVRFVYSHFGVSLPHSSFADLWHGHGVARRALKPGDLVFFAGASHVGIYIGRNRFIHAPHTGSVVSITPLSSSWYGAEYDGARRLRRWRAR